MSALDRDFLERFLSPPNTLELTPRFVTWVDRVKSDQDVVILPCRHDDSETIWYVAAKDTRTFRATRESIVAFLGLTYSNYSGGRPPSLDDSNTVESVLTEWFGKNVLKLRIPQSLRNDACTQLERFVALHDGQPQRTPKTKRAIGRVLRDYEAALHAGDTVTATRCLEECQRAGYLDPTNRRYLQLRIDEKREAWRAILDAVDTYNLLYHRHRPRRVSQAILRALYHLDFLEHEVDQDAVAAIQIFVSLYDRYKSLFTTETHYNCHEANAFFLMRAVVNANTQSKVMACHARLESLQETGGDVSWYAALLTQLPSDTPADSTPATPSDDLSTARTLLGRHELDAAKPHVEALAPNPHTVPMIVTWAYEMDTLEAAQFALNAYGQITSEEQVHLRRSRTTAGQLERLQDLATNDTTEPSGHHTIPQNWVQWITGILENETWGENARNVAERGAIDWDSREFENAGFVTQFADALSQLNSSKQQSLLLDSLPFLLESIEHCDPTPRILQDTLSYLIDYHLLDEAPPDTFFDTLTHLFALAVKAGLSEQNYDSHLRATCEHIAQASPTQLDTLLDFLEMLVVHKSPNPASRETVAYAIAQRFTRSHTRVTLDQKGLLRDLLRELECDVPDTLDLHAPESREAQTDSPWHALAGKTVALYSLNEPVLGRVKEQLEQSVTSITVKTFHDKVCTGQLTDSARSADIFVVAIAAAKHAATNCIGAVRGQKTILRPHGQGSASMLRVLSEHAAELDQNRTQNQ